MLKAAKRPLTPEERLNLLHLRPSFLLRERRQTAQRELDEGVAEVLDIEILRAWDMNGCRPPCCPHIYLFQTGEGEYIYTESWTAVDAPDGQIPKRRIEIVRSPLTKRILGVNTEEEVVHLEASPFDPATEYFLFSSNAECEILRADEMPEEVRSILSAR
jgi:hypothetical protein